MSGCGLARPSGPAAVAKRGRDEEEDAGASSRVAKRRRFPPAAAADNNGYESPYGDRDRAGLTGAGCAAAFGIVAALYWTVDVVPSTAQSHATAPSRPRASLAARGAAAAAVPSYLRSGRLPFRPSPSASPAPVLPFATLHPLAASVPISHDGDDDNDNDDNDDDDDEDDEDDDDDEDNNFDLSGSGCACVGAFAQVPRRSSAPYYRSSRSDAAVNMQDEYDEGFLVEWNAELGLVDLEDEDEE